MAEAADNVELRDWPDVAAHPRRNRRPIVAILIASALAHAGLLAASWLYPPSPPEATNIARVKVVPWQAVGDPNADADSLAWTSQPPTWALVDTRKLASTP